MNKETVSMQEVQPFDWRNLTAVFLEKLALGSIPVDLPYNDQVKEIIRTDSVLAEHMDNILAQILSNICRIVDGKKPAGDSAKLGGQLPAYYLPSGNFAENGWCRLPNGLILQWARFTDGQGIPDGDSGKRYPFPIRFPNGILHINGSNYANNGATTSAVFYNRSVDTLAWFNSNYTPHFMALAIGW